MAPDPELALRLKAQRNQGFFMFITACGGLLYLKVKDSRQDVRRRSGRPRSPTLGFEGLTCTPLGDGLGAARLHRRAGHCRRGAADRLTAA